MTVSVGSKKTIEKENKRKGENKKTLATFASYKP
jgi:hypothetical protein